MSVPKPKIIENKTLAPAKRGMDAAELADAEAVTEEDPLQAKASGLDQLRIKLRDIGSKSAGLRIGG